MDDIPVFTGLIIFGCDVSDTQNGIGKINIRHPVAAFKRVIIDVQGPFGYDQVSFRERRNRNKHCAVLTHQKTFGLCVILTLLVHLILFKEDIAQELVGDHEFGRNADHILCKGLIGHAAESGVAQFFQLIRQFDPAKSLGNGKG